VAETQVRVVFAEARHAFSLDRLECEFALSVADEWSGKGISTLLVADLECRARSLLCNQGKRTEALDLLAPIHCWFTEGHDTPVLKEARALLEQLS
jgi:GNAT superfamily N-acetyltransferase